ncbi:MAG: ATP-binding cassette domain-containing protein [Acidimicrobiia bacterium]|nr:ATP-binding cassette domain-containing protein [Actinomycetota bacterium]MBL6924607.1 ATP-binding cassette domain-containing protein [Acidimicrobiia bacterium]MBL6927364.1 ATP-binding cassette domain-containing protein [Acidimicrobiia bacterium]
MFPNLRRDVVFPVFGSVILFAVFVAVGLAYQSQFSGAAERLVTFALIDAILVLGIQIYVGNTGILSFGHIGFGAIAGYAFALFAISPAEKLKRIPDAPFGLLDVSVGPWMAVAVAVGVTLVVALIVGVGLARSGAESGAVSATVITLALLFVTHEVARNWPDLTGGDRAGLSFRIGGTLDSRVPIYIALLAAIVVARLYAQSRGGRLAVAAREDDLAARAMGVNPLVQQMVALLISVVVVSVGASLRVYENGSILPRDMFFNLTLVTLVMLIVGGRRSVTGALVGVAVITVGREVARKLGQDGFELFGIGLDGAPLDWIFRENLKSVFMGVSMLGFMIWRPAGLLDDWELDKWLHGKLGRRSASPPESLPPVEPDDSSVLVAQGVDVAFGGFQALIDVDVEAARSEVVGVIGPNGAGKTTLLNVITGLVESNSGSVVLGGTDLSATRSFKIARSGLVRTFQNLRLFDSLTVRENVEVSYLVAAAHRRHRPPPDVDGLIAAAGLWEQRDRRARELDYGTSRRLELARAAATAPAFLLLDEPTSGMSDSESLVMVEQVRQMAGLVGAGVVVIDHDLNFIIGICDRIYCLDCGQVIAEGTPAEIQADPVVQAAYIGSTAEG